MNSLSSPTCSFLLLFLGVFFHLLLLFQGSFHFIHAHSSTHASIRTFLTTLEQQKESLPDSILKIIDQHRRRRFSHFSHSTSKPNRGASPLASFASYATFLNVNETCPNYVHQLSQFFYHITQLNGSSSSLVAFPSPLTSSSSFNSNSPFNPSNETKKKASESTLITETHPLKNLTSSPAHFRVHPHFPFPSTPPTKEEQSSLFSISVNRATHPTDHAPTPSLSYLFDPCFKSPYRYHCLKSKYWLFNPDTIDFAASFLSVLPALTVEEWTWVRDLLQKTQSKVYPFLLATYEQLQAHPESHLQGLHSVCKLVQWIQATPYFHHLNSKELISQPSSPSDQQELEEERQPFMPPGQSTFSSFASSSSSSSSSSSPLLGTNQVTYLKAKFIHESIYFLFSATNVQSNREMIQVLAPLISLMMPCSSPSTSSSSSSSFPLSSTLTSFHSTVHFLAQLQFTHPKQLYCTLHAFMQSKPKRSRRPSSTPLSSNTVYAHWNLSKYLEFQKNMNQQKHPPRSSSSSSSSSSTMNTFSFPSMEFHAFVHTCMGLSEATKSESERDNNAPSSTPSPSSSFLPFSLNLASLIHQLKALPFLMHYLRALHSPTTLRPSFSSSFSSSSSTSSFTFSSTPTPPSPQTKPHFNLPWTMKMDPLRPWRMKWKDLNSQFHRVNLKPKSQLHPMQSQHYPFSTMTMRPLSSIPLDIKVIKFNAVQPSHFSHFQHTIPNQKDQDQKKKTVRVDEKRGCGCMSSI